MPQSAQSAASGRRGNRLLEMLTDADANRILEQSERVALPIKKVVAHVGESPDHAYFPLSCVLSAIVPLRDGSAIEAGSIGNEGMSGVDLMTDRVGSIYRIVVQIEGEALRLPAKKFRQVLVESNGLSELMKRYALTVLHQASQSAACNVRHHVEERMARWLLMTHDRAGRDEFYLTQEFLGIMLGVRRQSVSLTASTLYEAGLLTYSRGNMKILNREGLEQISCECYEAIRDNYEQVMRPENR